MKLSKCVTVVENEGGCEPWIQFIREQVVRKVMLSEVLPHLDETEVELISEAEQIRLMKQYFLSRTMSTSKPLSPRWSKCQGRIGASSER